MGYVTGKTIRELRERRGITQRELAERIHVSDKTVSKWETGKGLPDIAIIGELAGALGVSVTELFTGDLRENENRAGNMKKMNFYVCPVCGNVITSAGEGAFSCCGITLPPLEPELCDAEHAIRVEDVDAEWYVTVDHPMKKEHYLSFLAYATTENAEVVKLYPEQDVSVRFRKKGHGMLCVYCNRHGMYRKMI